MKKPIELVTSPCTTRPLTDIETSADERAWHAKQSAIRAVSPASVRRLTVNPYDAVAVVLGQEEALRGLVGVVSDDGCVKLEGSMVDDAVAFARAARHLSTVVDARRRPPASVVAQVEQATTVRDRLVRWIDMAIAETKLDAGARVLATNSHGYADIGRDIMKAAGVLTDGWSHVEGFVPFTRAELAAASETGSAMTTMAYGRIAGHEAVSDEITALVADRDAAFELTFRAWGQIQRRVAYVRFAAGDVDRYAPSLFTRAPSNAHHASSETPGAPSTGTAASDTSSVTSAHVDAPADTSVVLKPEDSPFES